MRQPFILVALLAWQLPSSESASITLANDEVQPTCSSETINFIAHTLAQQCLQTDHIRLGSKSESAGDDSVDWPSLPLSELDPRDGDIVSKEASASIQPRAWEAPGSSEVVPRSKDPSATVEQTGTPTEPTAFEDEDSDPLSDQGSFLSFEEWKARMLKEAGQSPDHVVGTTTGSERSSSGRNRQAGIEDMLDSLGDEGEIELDFSGFVNGDTAPSTASNAVSQQEKQADATGEQVKASKRRSRDAGTTSKERFNYASFDCAATVLKTNTGSKGATWILSENKDSYLLNKCSEKNKHFIVELCNDIWIDTVVLGNFEFFSSTFRQFRVSIADSYPVKSDKWKEIGTFEARNTRGVQAFVVEDGTMWARYFKIELLTHYGKEHYCPVSLLRVHGKTMMDDFRNDMKESHEPEDDEESEEYATITGQEELSDRSESSGVAVPSFIRSKSSSHEPSPVEQPASIRGISRVDTDQNIQQTQVMSVAESTSVEMQQNFERSWHGLVSARHHQYGLCSLGGEEQASDISGEFSDQETPSVLQSARSTTTVSNGKGETPEALNTPAVTGLPTAPADATERTATTTTFMSTAAPVPTDAQNVDVSVGSPTIAEDGASINSKLSIESKNTPVRSTAAIAVKSQSGGSVTTAPSTRVSMIESSTSSENHTVNATITNVAGKSRGTKIPTPLKAAPAVPATQDSFFRSVHKRLQMLESNSTLSLQYIEEQSRILRDAFGKAEKRQLLRTSNFLEVLNSTVLGELRDFRIQYNQIWESTVLELASQREQSQKEVRALGERLSLLADELVWQKRVVYLQFILIVLCLGLVMFGRNDDGHRSRSGPLELSLLQSIQGLGRSRDGVGPRLAKRYSGSPESRPGTPSRPSSIGGQFHQVVGHRRYLSDGITSGEETGVGTEVATSPDNRRTGEAKVSELQARFHSRDIVNEMAPTDLTRSEISGIHQLPPVRPMIPELRVGAERVNANPSSASDQDDTSDMPGADPISLKRAASSPILGQYDEESASLDDKVSTGS